MHFRSRFGLAEFGYRVSVVVLPALAWAAGCGGTEDGGTGLAAPTTTTTASSVTPSGSTPAPVTPITPVTPTNPVTPTTQQPVAPVTPSTTSPATQPPSPTTSAPTTSPSTSETSSSTTTSSDPSSEPAASSEPADTSSGAGPTSEPTPGGDACPASATFCSGFESAELPAGAVFKVNGDPATPWTSNFEVDSTQKNTGNSSLKVKGASEGVGSYKMLAVPSGGAAFWARFYLRSDKEIGVHDHNAIAIASISDDPNGGGVEFAEDVGLSFNASDNVRWPEGYGRTMSGGEMPYALPADAWHCIELSFDGSGRVQKLFIEGEQMINATEYPASAMAFTTFKFGYNALHGTARSLWYDDVAVGPSQIGCL